MSRRAITVGGGVAAAGIGYYLYQAGGDPKVAKGAAQRTVSCLLYTTIADNSNR